MSIPNPAEAKATSTTRTAWGRHGVAGLAVALAVFVVLSALRPGLFVAGLTPHATLTPAEVVAIQLSALRTNRSDDEGIAVAFRFASPKNRAQTGPVTRFAAILRSDRYLALLNHIDAAFGVPVTTDERSYVPVVVTDVRGVNSAFVWVLSRHSGGACEACWMTERVVPTGELSRVRFA